MRLQSGVIIHCVTFQCGCVFVTCMLARSSAQKGKEVTFNKVIPINRLAFKIFLTSSSKGSLTESFIRLHRDTEPKCQPVSSSPQIPCEHRLLWPNDYGWTVSSSVNRLIQHSYSGKGFESTNLEFRCKQTTESLHNYLYDAHIIISTTKTHSGLFTLLKGAVRTVQKWLFCDKDSISHKHFPLLS